MLDEKVNQNANKETSSGNAMSIEWNSGRVCKIEASVIGASVKHQLGCSDA